MGVLKRHAVLLIFLLAGLGVAAATVNTYLDNQTQRSGRGFGSAPSVVTERAEVRRLVDSVESIGTALASESVVLTSKVTDTVRKVNFDDGDFVDVGDILV